MTKYYLLNSQNKWLRYDSDKPGAHSMMGIPIVELIFNKRLIRADSDGTGFSITEQTVISSDELLEIALKAEIR